MVVVSEHAKVLPETRSWQCIYLRPLHKTQKHIRVSAVVIV